MVAAMERQRPYRRIGPSQLVIMGIVLIVASYPLDMPDAVGLALGIVFVLVGLGVGLGRRRTTPSIWSAIGLGVSLLSAALTLDGMGVGTPWWESLRGNAVGSAEPPPDDGVRE